MFKSKYCNIRRTLQHTWTQIDVIISFDIIICFKVSKSSFEKCQPTRTKNKNGILNKPSKT